MGREDKFAGRTVFENFPIPSQPLNRFSVTLSRQRTLKNEIQALVSPFEQSNATESPFLDHCDRKNQMMGQMGGMPMMMPIRSIFRIAEIGK